MTSTRQHKVSKLLLRELADYFQKHGSSICGGKMVSVTVVRISPDLGVAKVYLSIFPSKDLEIAVQSVSDLAPVIRNEMGKRMRNQLRHIPEFIFYPDDSLDYINNIENLLND